MGGPEYARFCGPNALEPLGIYLPGDENYPGSRPFSACRVLAAVLAGALKECLGPIMGREVALSVFALPAPGDLIAWRSKGPASSFARYPESHSTPADT